MKAYFEYKELCGFDQRNDWTRFNGLYGWTMIGPTGKVKHYITYGGGPEGGIVHFKGKGWYIWHRSWDVACTYLKIPDGLHPVYRCDEDGVERVKLVDGSWECRDTDFLWDDVMEEQEEEESESEEENHSEESDSEDDSEDEEEEEDPESLMT